MDNGITEQKNDVLKACQCINDAIDNIEEPITVRAKLNEALGHLGMLVDNVNELPKKKVLVSGGFTSITELAEEMTEYFSKDS
jgi:hypothetical protein